MLRGVEEEGLEKRCGRRRRNIQAAASAAVYLWGLSGVEWSGVEWSGKKVPAPQALIVADYKLSLAGMVKDSEPFVAARHEVHERSAARLLRLCERNGGVGGGASRAL